MGGFACVLFAKNVLKTQCKNNVKNKTKKHKTKKHKTKQPVPKDEEKPGVSYHYFEVLDLKVNKKNKFFVFVFVWMCAEHT